MKKFYKEVAASKETDGYAILLDGRAVKTPSKKTVMLPTLALAEAVAQEWRGQGEKIDMNAMYLTRLAYGVLELTDAGRTMLGQDPTRAVEAVISELNASERECFARSLELIVGRLSTSRQPGSN